MQEAVRVAFASLFLASVIGTNQLNIYYTTVPRQLSNNKFLVYFN